MTAFVIVQTRLKPIVVGMIGVGLLVDDIDAVQAESQIGYFESGNFGPLRFPFFPPGVVLPITGDRCPSGVKSVPDR